MSCVFPIFQFERRAKRNVRGLRSRHRASRRQDLVAARDSDRDHGDPGFFGQQTDARFEFTRDTRAASRTLGVNQEVPSVIHEFDRGPQ